MKSKLTLPFAVFILTIALSVGMSAFKKAPHTIAKDYWIYVPTSSGFNDTSKYQKVTLNSTGDQ